MKRSPLRRKTPIRVAGHSETAALKQEIQDLVREIVIARDGGCVFRNLEGYAADLPTCNGYRKDGQLVLQADHLITRANSATYADTRLIVCVCKGHHGWKRWHQKEYEMLVRSLIGKERAALWDRCEADSWRPTRRYQADWTLAVAALRNELSQLQG